MNTFNRLVFVFLAVASISACAPMTPVIDSRSASVETFSLGTVQAKIKKGVTLKSEVLILLGGPNLVSRNRDGMEVHVWDKRTSESEKSQGFGKSVEVRNERTITIAITYNKKDIVEDVSYRVTSY